MMIQIPILLIELLLLGGLMFALHRLSFHLGLAPLIVFLLSLMVGVRLATLFDASTTPQLRYASVVLIPLILTAVLLIYSVNGTRAAQITIISLFLFHFAFVFTIIILALHQQWDIMTPVLVLEPALVGNLWRAAIISSLALLGGILTAIVSFQRLQNNNLFSLGLRLVLALVLALTVDNLLFDWVFVGIISWPDWLWGTGAKITAVFLLTPLLMLYLRHIAPLQSQQAIRPTLDVFSLQDFQQMRQALGQASHQRDEAERELVATNRLWRDIVDNMPVMLDALDENGTFAVWNKECERVTGYTAEEVIGNPEAVNLFYPDDAYRDQLIEQWAETGSNYRHWEIELTCKDGSKRVIAWSSIADLYPVPGWRSWAVGVDVTEQRQLEDAVRQQTRLAALGQLAAGIAHDYNNLLLAMTLQSDLLARRLPADDAQLQRHLQRLQQALQQAGALTGQLLAYTGKGQTRYEPLDLNDLLRQNAGLFLAGLTKTVHLKLDLEPNLPLIEGDKGQVQQVLMNLVINAAQAIENSESAGMVRLHTAVFSATAEELQAYRQVLDISLVPGDYVCLQVTDSGPGIAPAHLRRIFEPYFTTKQQGHGLGLAAVLGIMRTHKGGVRVESELGQGTTFSLIWPAVSRSTAPTPDTAVPPQASPVGNGLILIIDDERIVREGVADSLTEAGFRVMVASNGIEGELLYQQHGAQIDLVVLDLTMPDKSGLEVLHTLRQLNPQVKVILSSGFHQEPLPELGDVQFLQKPYDRDRLLGQVRKIALS